MCLSATPTVLESDSIMYTSQLYLFSFMKKQVSKLVVELCPSVMLFLVSNKHLKLLGCMINTFNVVHFDNDTCFAMQIRGGSYESCF